MRLEVGIGAARSEQAFVREALECFVHSRWGLSGSGKKLYTGAIRIFLLLSLIGQQGPPDHFLWTGNCGRPGVGEPVVWIAAPRTSHHSACAEQHGDDHLRL